MVDRITPRPPPELRERVHARHRLGRRRAGHGESFIQWVIEDNFIAGRPDWERVGVQMVDSVAPYEEAKIRILNATPQLHRLGRHADRPAVHPRRHAHAGDPPDGLRLRHRRRDPLPEPTRRARARSTCRRTATWCSSASATPRSATPTSASRWTASRRSPASSRRPCASGWRRAQSIDSVAMLPALFLAFLQRWHRGAAALRLPGPGHGPGRARTRSARRPTRWPRWARTPGCGASWPATRGWSSALRRAAQRVSNFERDYS